MAKTEKGTRIRGLPPRVQLDEQSAQSGSYPTNSRFSLDGRTGREPVKFEDNKTVVFRGVNTYYPAVGLEQGSVWVEDSAHEDLDLVNTITSPGVVRSQVVDSLPWVGYLTSGSAPPFHDEKNFEVDGKSLNNLFYATGSATSDVGEGFDEPLWSKQKIEVDISVGIPSTLTFTSASALNETGRNFPMAYYNFQNKTWDRLGQGLSINATNSKREVVDKMMLGFAPSIFPAGRSFYNLKSCGYALSDFGFPYHPKFHATSSQTLSMNSYIDRPFLLEKITIETSASWVVGSVLLAAINLAANQTVTASVTTCFLLNQRDGQRFSFAKSLPDEGDLVGTGAKILLTASVPSRAQLTPGTNFTEVKTTRDIVSFSNIFSFGLDASSKTITSNGVTSTPREVFSITSNDVVLESLFDGVSGANWSNRLVISMSAVTPSFTTFPITSMVTRLGSVSDYDEVPLGYDGYRTGMGLEALVNRGLTNDLFNSATSQTASLGTTTLGTPLKKTKTNPYVLLPSDKLVLGFQMPVTSNPAQLIIPGLAESSLTMHTGSFKMTLYGSYVLEGHENNETVSQLLSSDNIHETIE